MNFRSAAFAIFAALTIFGVLAVSAAPKPITVDPELLANAPAIGKVIAYNGNWGFAVTNAGSSKGIKVGNHFAVRRKGRVIIIGIVEDVSKNQSSIGFLDLRLNGADTNRPHLGDEIIIYPPKRS
ncbi:MAG: hypothetical protein ACI8UO_004120 [Verrucomicrobiales bacterium]|jgi:hypothetical protein